MATEIIAQAPKSTTTEGTGNNYKPSSKMMDSFRNATDPENKTGKNPKTTEQPKKEAATEAPKATNPMDALKKEEPKQEAPKETAPQNVEPVQSDKEVNLANLRKINEELSKKAADLEKRVPKDYEEVKKREEELAKQNEDLIKEIEKTNLERSPRFQEKYDKPQEKLLNSIKKTLSNTDSHSDDLIGIIQQPESKERTQKLAEALDEMDKLSQGKVTRAISEFDDLRSARQNELGNPSQTYQQYKNEQELQTRQARESDALLMKNIIKQAEERIEWFKENGIPEWDEMVRGARTHAVSLWTENHPKEALAEATFKSALVPIYESALQRMGQQLELANKEISSLRSATPSNNAGTSPKTSTTSNGKHSDSPAIAAFHQKLGR